MIKCLLSRPGLIAGPLQINSQSIPRLDPIDSKSSSRFIPDIKLFRLSSENISSQYDDRLDKHEE